MTPTQPDAPTLGKPNGGQVADQGGLPLPIIIIELVNYALRPMVILKNSAPEGVKLSQRLTRLENGLNIIIEVLRTY